MRRSCAPGDFIVGAAHTAEYGPGIRSGLTKDIYGPAPVRPKPKVKTVAEIADMVSAATAHARELARILHARRS
jgi:hypothetical protein